RNLFATLHRDADLLAVFHLGADARRLVGLGVDEHHVAGVNRRLDFEDSAGLVGGGLHVALDEVHSLDHHTITAQLLDAAATSLVVSAGDDHVVTDSEPLHHSTSGAREMIFMKRL